MAWYDTGVVAVTNGSTTVTGTGTDFISGAQVGEAFLAPDDKLYEIQSITSATVLVLADPYLGSTQSGQDYKIVPTQSLVADLASQVTDLITDYSDVKDTAGAGKFNDGTVTAPGITFEQDQNNGLYRIGSDNWGLVAGGEKIVDVSTNGIKLDDNNKATFGTGDDLQIYHDGSASYIADTGTGTLNIKASGSIRLRGNDTDELLARFNENGSNQFYYDNAEKLATTSTGVDVTGTVTADGLKSSDDIEIATSSIFGQGLGYAGNTSSAGAGTMSLYDATTGGVIIDGFAPSYLADSGVILKQGGVKGFHLKNNNNVEFFEDTGTTAKFVWDSSAERLGIGTPTPSNDLHISSATGSARLTSSAGGANLFMDSADGNTTRLRWNSNSNFALRNDATSTDIINVTQAGNVGIGTASPIAPLTVNGQIRASGTGGYGFNSPGDTDGGMFSPSDGVVTFKTNGTERARIDSSGNLLVGMTLPLNSTAGMYVRPSSSSGFIADGTNALTLGRLNSDGVIANFLKDGSQVGSIGVVGGDLHISSSGTNHAGIRFDTAVLTPCINNSQTDATVSLGYSSYRYKDLYLSGNVIQSQVAPNGNNGASGTGNSGNYWKLGSIHLNGTQATEIRVLGTSSYSAGSGIAGCTTIRLRGSNANTTIEGYFYGETQGNNTFTDVRWVNTSDDNFDIYVKGGAYSAINHWVDTDGSWTPALTDTGSTSPPSGSIALASRFTITTNGTEKMRLDSSGNLLVGTTSRGNISEAHEIRGSSTQGGKSILTVANMSGTAESPALNVANTNASTDSTNRLVQFYANYTGSTATPMGGIVGNGSGAVQFASISDEREKENITPVNSVTDKLKALDVVEFDFINQGDHVNYGFIAQNVEAVFPEFVISNLSGEGEEERKGIAGGMSNGYIAVLTKALQEALTEIDNLKQRVDAMENN